MKKILLSLFCLLFMGLLVQAQVEVLKTEKHLIDAQFDLSNNEFKILSSGENSKDDFLKITSIRYEEKEIQIDFSNLDFTGAEYYRLQVSASLEEIILPIRPENILGAVNKNILIEDAPELQTLVWTNLVEDFVALKGRLKITLYTEIYGRKELPYKVNCGVKPEFTNKQKMPFLIAALAGTGSLVTGQLFKQASDKEYADYLSQETFEVANPILLSANDKHHKDLVFTSVGAALLAGDVIWFLIRQRRYKKQIATYRKFCKPTEELTIRPVFEVDPKSTLVLQTGLNIKWRF